MDPELGSSVLLTHSFGLLSRQCLNIRSTIHSVAGRREPDRREIALQCIQLRYESIEDGERGQIWLSTGALEATLLKYEPQVPMSR
jgi:hypothetical protein